METKCRLFFVHAWLAIWLAVAFHARGDEVRIAVVGDSSLSDLVDLTAPELSKSTGLNLLERSDLANLGQEQALQSNNEISKSQRAPRWLPLS